MRTDVPFDEQETTQLPVVRTEHPHPMRRAYNACLWIVVLALVGVAAAVAVVPMITGAQTLIVLTGSMTPYLPVGGAAVVRPEPAEDIRRGDVITFTDREDGSTATKVVTHRVVGIEPGPAGPVFVTKGDANEDNDPGTVAADDVQGVLWYQVPAVGTVRDALGKPTGLLLGAGAGLVLLAGHLLIPTTTTRRRATGADRR